jgi:hypothetical protein
LVVVALLSWVSLILFFVLGGPLGTLNDGGNGLLALLCGILALGLRRRTSIWATMLALLGAVTALLGSFLVMSERTGYFLAGLVSGLGFALIGAWLVLLGRSGQVTTPRLAQAGGAVMALGFLNVPGILWGLDDQASAPAWLMAVGISWTGTYLLLPIWAFRLARRPMTPEEVQSGGQVTSPR